MRSLLLCLALCAASPAQANSSSSDTDAVTVAPSATEQKSSVETLSGGGQAPRANIALEPSDAASSTALTKAELCERAASEAAANNLPTDFFTNLIQQESGFRPHVVSPAGAQGIAQFMPPVASSYGLANPFEPVAALRASARLLADLVEQFGNLGLAAAAYNAGPKRVQDWLNKRGKLPAETRHYVHKITGRSAVHWANARASGSESLISDDPCRDLFVAGAGKTKLPAATRITAEKSERNVQSIIGEGIGSRQRTILSPRVAIGSVSALATKSSRRASLQTELRDKVMSRFVATPTPTIMTEEKKDQSRRDVIEKSSHRLLPRPSEFIVGARVPAAIKASEAAVLSRSKTSARWAQEMNKGRNRMANADPNPRGPAGKPQRKT